MKKTIIIVVLLFVTIKSISAQESRKVIKITDDIEILQLSDNVYLHTSYLQTENYDRVGANGLIMVQHGKGLMIDTPWNNKLTEELFNWFKDSLNVAIESVIVTHWHDDCMGGLDFLKSQGVKSYAHQMTVDIAIEKGLPVPQEGFTYSLMMEHQHVLVKCHFWGGGHTTDNIVVYLPIEGILFGGCCIKDMNSSNLGNISDADLEEWPTTLDRINRIFSDAIMIVPGHGAVGGNELIQHTIELLKN